MIYLGKKFGNTNYTSTFTAFSSFLRLPFWYNYQLFFELATLFCSIFQILFFFQMNIFVAKLNYDTSDDTLLGAFEEFGTVDSAKIIMDKFTGRSKGFGFVEMPNDAEAKNAINALNETELDGRTIVVKVAEPKGERPQRRERY